MFLEVTWEIRTPSADIWLMAALERTQEFRQILLIDVGDVHMLRVLGNGLGIELDGVHYLDGIGAECRRNSSEL